MIRKVALINPYFEGIKPDAPQLGLYFLATYIKEHTNCQVEVIDPLTEGLSENDVLSKTKSANIIGLTCFTDIRFQCFNFAEKAKEINPESKIIIGGVHPTSLSEKILREYPFIDIIVRGEGEETLLEISNNIPNSEILGITYRSKNEIIKNKDRPLSKDIDKFHLDYSLMPKDYTTFWKDHEVPKELLKLNHIPIIASRGCPYNCYYCSSHPYWNSTYRVLHPEELVERMTDAVNNYNINYFRFYDALFPASWKWISDFYTLLKKKNLNINFRIDIRNIDKKNLRKLKEVGCRIVGIGIESGNQKIRENLNKNIAQKQIFNIIRTCKDLEYWIVGYFMLGLPSEDRSTIKETIKLTKYFDYHNLTRFQVYPNTIIYNLMKQIGEINDDIWFNKTLDGRIEPGKDYFYNIRASNYCKENFPSAPFSQRELDWFMQYSFDYHNVHNPISVLNKYGISKGILVLTKSLLDIPTRGMVHKIYENIRCTYNGRTE